MSYIWEFETEGRSPTPLGRNCFRGPMINFELRLSQPFTVTTAFADTEKARVMTLTNLVDTSLVAVQTRECLLRALYSPMGPLYVRMYPDRKALWTLICEKRNSVLIDTDMSPWYFLFSDIVNSFSNFRIPEQTLDTYRTYLESNSPILRVAACCAIMVHATYIELG